MGSKIGKTLIEKTFQEAEKYAKKIKEGKLKKEEEKLKAKRLFIGAIKKLLIWKTTCKDNEYVVKLQKLGTSSLLFNLLSPEEIEKDELFKTWIEENIEERQNNENFDQLINDQPSDIFIPQEEEDEEEIIEACQGYEDDGNIYFNGFRNKKNLIGPFFLVLRIQKEENNQNIVIRTDKRETVLKNFNEIEGECEIYEPERKWETFQNGINIDRLISDIQNNGQEFVPGREKCFRKLNHIIKISLMEDRDIYQIIQTKLKEKFWRDGNLRLVKFKTLENEDSYYGQWENGERQGFGEQVSKCGRYYYAGNFDSGHMTNGGYGYFLVELNRKNDVNWVHRKNREYIVKEWKECRIEDERKKFEKSKLVGKREEGREKAILTTILDEAHST